VQALGLLKHLPSEGYHYYQMLHAGIGSGTQTWWGNPNQNGLFGTIHN
jgi:hypothetical protein